MAYKEKFPTFSGVNSTGLMYQNQTSEPMREVYYELELALVIKIYTDEPGKVQIFSLFSQKQLDCYPLTQNIKVVPILGELVIFREYKLGRDNAERQYFYEPLSWNNSVHSNDFPDSLQYVIEGLKKAKQPQINIDRVEGEVEKLKSSNIGSYYKKDMELYDKSLVHMQGNILFEGRNGQSIRFGSSIPKKVQLEGEIYKKSNWYSSKNETKGGSPFIILSSGKTNSIAKLVLEDLQNDPSTIFMSSGGNTGVTLPFLLSSNNKPKAVKIPSIYEEGIVLINSDRLVFNAKITDITLSSKNDILILSNRNIWLNTSDTLQLASSTINLGESANKEGQAVVKAADLMNFLDEMADAILSIKQYNGAIIPGTDLQLRNLQQRLKRAINGRGNEFSSETTFTL